MATKAEIKSKNAEKLQKLEKIVNKASKQFALEQKKKAKEQATLTAKKFVEDNTHKTKQQQLLEAEKRRAELSDMNHYVFNEKRDITVEKETDLIYTNEIKQIKAK